MTTAPDREKLRVLLAHWVEHNRQHAEDFRDWAQRAEQLALKEVASNLGAAVKQMDLVNARLEAALDALGGALEDHP